MQYFFSVISLRQIGLYKHKREDYDVLKAIKTMTETVHYLHALSPEVSEVLQKSAYATVHGEAPVVSAKSAVPYTTRVPELLSAPVHAVISNGFVAVKETSDELASELAGLGIATTIIDPARTHSSLLDWPRHILNPQQLHYEALQGVIEHSARNIEFAKVPNGHVIHEGKIVAIGHSMGNLPTMEYGTKNPDKVDAVISLQGVGLEEPLGLKLVWRTKDVVLDVANHAVRGHFKGYGLRMLTRSTGYIMRNPVRTGAEAISCMLADKRSAAAQLASLGVRHEVICGENDSYFRYEDTLEAMQQVASGCHVLEDMSHVGPQVQPLRTARFLGSLITAR